MMKPTMTNHLQTTSAVTTSEYSDQTIPEYTSMKSGPKKISLPQEPTMVEISSDGEDMQIQHSAKAHSHLKTLVGTEEHNHSALMIVKDGIRTGGA